MNATSADDARCSDEAPNLEQLLGDPWDAGNPFGYARGIAADERGESDECAESMLDQWQLNAEFVPLRLGGRWSCTEDMIHRLRPLFRRDAALGLGYGVTSLMAAVNVWAAGTPMQQQELSRLLLSGKKVSIAYHELDHGNDFLRNECVSYPSDTGSFFIHGSKHVINNVHRAAAWIIFARTASTPGARSHSLFLLKPDQAMPGSWHVLPRFHTSGVRACHLSGLQFNRLEAPPASLLGEQGNGAEIALRSFQVTRIVLPGMAIGMLDTGLRLAADFAMKRRLYGDTIVSLPRVRRFLSASLLDLLSMDCLVTAAARALHLAPQHASVYAAAVKYLVPSVLKESLGDLSIVLGARAYLRDGKYAMFGKLLRDIPVVGLGHAGGTVCLLTIMAQLPTLARHATNHAPLATALFEARSPMPPFDFSALSIAARGADTLLGTLASGLDVLEAAGEGGTSLARLVRELSAAFDALCSTSRRLSPAQIGPAAPAASFELAQRYALLAMAAACLGVWLIQRRDSRHPFLQNPEWVTAALARIRWRLAHGKPLTSESLDEPLALEVLRRVDDNLSFCLSSTPLHGSSHVCHQH
jgi:alkylation response protein AidB-like acyl-CoA dehydrogenase